MRPRVFVVNVPLRRAGDRMRPEFDVSPATAHGTIVYVTRGGKLTEDGNELARAVAAGLDTFAPGDYLLPTGDIGAIMMAAVIAADRAGGVLRWLAWDRRLKTYEKREARLFEPHEAEPKPAS